MPNFGRIGWQLWFLLCVLFVFGPTAMAAPIAEAASDGLRVVLTDEKCAQSAVANLPNRATWTEKGKTFEGCFAATAAGIVILYFEDKSVTVIPSRLFVLVSAT